MRLILILMLSWGIVLPLSAQKNTQFAIDFLDEFASKWLHFPDTYFFTPSMTVARLQSKGVFEAKNGVAKGSENLEPWLGNDYQKQFLKQLTEMEGAIQYFNRPIWTKLWEQLQAVENFEALTAQKYPNLSPFKDEKEAFIALSNMITYLQLQMNKAN